MIELYDRHGNVVSFPKSEVSQALAQGYTEEDPLEGMRPKDRAEKVRRAHLRRKRLANMRASQAEGAERAALLERAKLEGERLRALSTGEWDGSGRWPREKGEG
jgi:hypothetical protein